VSQGKVFVPHHDGRLNLSDAQRFGTLEILFLRDFYPDTANAEMPEIMKRAYDVLRPFNPVNDFVCLVGAPPYIGVCLYVLGDCAKAPVRMLRFDKLERKYYPIDIK
jgi:hypothetical protein